MHRRWLKPKKASVFGDDDEESDEDEEVAKMQHDTGHIYGT